MVVIIRPLRVRPLLAHVAAHQVHLLAPDPMVPIATTVRINPGATTTTPRVDDWINCLKVFRQEVILHTVAQNRRLAHANDIAIARASPNRVLAAPVPATIANVSASKA